MNIPVLCTFVIYDKHLSTNIMVRCTFNFWYKPLPTNITVLRTFMTNLTQLFCKYQPEIVITSHANYYIFKAAELRNICRN
jgi:hypothetical protein